MIEFWTNKRDQDKTTLELHAFYQLKTSSLKKNWKEIRFENVGGCPTKQAILDRKGHGYTSRKPPAGIDVTSPQTEAIALTVLPPR
jgi:hypothetical protein